ncbi:uncharacterized protein LOC133840143 [Drosophila sulfurigaster albostrigata]|uniref:uncharacterized protein LOC133840143 n=1 Tax=Drosophila sulfurigaster albostrigata TaxID=89887 RepID=UPI002D218A44|nr:uncharacterized protein LOC133840143 [Drosophila sulfurigaster albostrigata]
MQLNILLLFLYGLHSTQNSKMTPEITQTLMELNAKYATELNVFINFQEFYMDFQLLISPAIQLQMTAEKFRRFRLHDNFSHNALIIIDIRVPPLDPEVAYHLPYLLRELHELHIVFITDQDPQSWQQDLFRYCFREGFINTLLIHQNNRNVSFYSYIPYPEMHIQKLFKLEEYFTRWQLHCNFHHYPVRTIANTNEPRKIQYVNRKGQLVHAGYIYNIFLEFTRRHNATLKILPEIETDELTWNLTSTSPLYLLKDYIILPHSRPIASYLYFRKPFAWTVWLAVVATVVYGMVMFYASCGSAKSEMGIFLLNSLCHVLFISQSRITVFNWQQMTIHFIMILGGFILTNSYLAMLSSILASGLFEPQLNTLEDLNQSPYPLLVDDYYIDYLKEAVSLPEEVKNRMCVDTQVGLNKARIGLNASFMYTAYEDRMEGILYQQHLLKVPRFKKIPESLMTGLMAFPVAPSLPYLSMLNVYMRRIFECGIFAKMMSDSWMDTIESGIYKLMRSEGVEQKPYDLEFFYYAFALWAIGLTLAGLAFIFEMFIK